MKKIFLPLLPPTFGVWGDKIAAALKEEATSIPDLQIKMMELVVFHAAALNLMDTFSSVSRVYGYRMDYVPNIYGGKPGAYHGAEVGFFFGTERTGMSATEGNNAARATLQKDWLTFIRTGEIPWRTPYHSTHKKITHYHGDQGAADTVPFPYADLLQSLEGSTLALDVVNAYMRRR